MNVKLIQAWIAKNGPNGVTQLAAKCGVTEAAIYRILRGKSRRPSFHMVQRVAKVIGASVEELGCESTGSRKSPNVA